MELFGVGPLEILLVVLLALALFGPKDIVRNARGAGRFISRLYKSEGWRTMQEASSALRNLPNRLAREAELEELASVRRQLDETERPKAAPPESPPSGGGMAAWTPDGGKTPPPPDGAPLP